MMRLVRHFVYAVVLTGMFLAMMATCKAGAMETYTVISDSEDSVKVLYKEGSLKEGPCQCVQFGGSNGVMVCE